jgi:hypothetical protein
VRQENTGVRIDIRPGVFSLASLFPTEYYEYTSSMKHGTAYLQEDIRNKGVYLANELKQLVIRQMLQRKLALSSVTGISFPEDSVAVSGNNLTTLEGRPDVLLDSLIGCILTNLPLHLAKPDKDFLISETVKGASETVEGGRVGKERI